ncbi:MAG: DUF2235 domain-containing protein, partial [Gemmatimonadaceae bacterium]
RRDRSMRRLIVCADGTWNTPEEMSGNVSTPTNVVKIHDALALQSANGTPQLRFYHVGVGTAGGLDHLTGGAFGDGIDRNIQDCYRWLAQQYQAGDEIYVFGFSRGAYTVRSLAGLVRKCGLVNDAGKIGDAYAFYRDRSDDTKPSSEKAQDFRAQFSREVTIKFVGVWDTVGALGIPIHVLQFLDGDKYNFHDVSLSSTVQFAYHALAIDEARAPFAPCIWEQAPVDGQTVVQVWFSGVHSNVGGGYPNTGLSDIALDWMRRRAEGAGLAFDADYLTAILQCNDRGTLYNSFTGFYNVFGRLVRPIRGPRAGDLGLTTESLSSTALDLWSNLDTYAAPNIHDYSMRVPPADPGAVTDVQT